MALLSGIASKSLFHDWLGNFFLLDSQNSLRPLVVDGRPLYAYGAIEKEYQSLLKLFKENPNILSQQKPRYTEWCACYCLAASEVYRREYTGGDWTWDFFDTRIPLKFSRTNPNQRYEILREGLKYWKRDLLTMTKGNTYYLGTLFSEGGLPVKLLADAADNGFQDVITFGISKYTDSQTNFRPLSEYLQPKLQKLSRIFQSEQASSLFTKTIDALMQLAAKYPLHTHTNPAAFLDIHEKNWYALFPFSLAEESAKNMVNKWLGKAAEQQKTQPNQKFECQHFTSQEHLVLTAQLQFPSQYSFWLPNYQGHTVLQWQIFEGNQAYPHLSGTVFAKLSDDYNELMVTFPNKKPLELQRSDHQKILSIRFFSDGQVIEQIKFPESQFEADAPFVFTRLQDKWKLISNSHYSRINTADYLLCLPKGFSFTSQYKPQQLQTVESTLGQCYLVSGSIQAKRSSDSQIIHIEYDEKNTLITPKLNGRFFHYLEDVDGLPIYQGWPKIEGIGQQQCTQIRIQNQTYSRRDISIFGTFTASFLTTNGLCLLTKRMCVLPEDLNIHWSAAKIGKPASLNITSTTNLNTAIHASNLSITKSPPHHFNLQVLDHNNIPETVVLTIGNHPAGFAAHLKMQFPYLGAHLFNEQGQYLHTQSTELSIEDLLGKHIIVSTGKSNTSNLKLHCTLLPEKIVHTIDLHINANTTLIYLQHFKSMLVQLFSCSHNQDSVVQLSLEDPYQHKPWLKLNLKRYHGLIVWNNQALIQGQWLSNPQEPKTHFQILEKSDSVYAATHAKVNMMRLDAPSETKTLLPDTSLPNYQYHLLATDHAQGIWLIYPAADSPLRFRPSVWDNTQDLQTDISDSLSLYQAARSYHPIHNQYCIDTIISDMGYDHDHPGWKYLEELKAEAYQHLSLSIFEVWKALARTPQALTTAVFKLNLDQDFCERIRQELAVVWEWIPNAIWNQSYIDHKNQCLALKNQLQQINPSLNLDLNMFLKTAPDSLFLHTNDLRTHIVNGFSQNKLNLPIIKNILLNQYNDVRKLHGEERWPEALNKPLSTWIASQQSNLCQLFKHTSQVSFDQSVLYLPLLCAHIKVGQVYIEDVFGDEHHQTINNFYQIYHFDSNWFNYICAICTSYLMENPQ